MNYKKLNVIDFSQGIKSLEVMENDLCLQDQIKRERLAISGSGINYGLNLELIENFKLKIHPGTLIDRNGDEISINEKILNIEIPFLTLITNERIYPAETGKITLSDIPYAQNRLEPSEFAPVTEWGITLRYEDNLSEIINISNIEGNVLFTNAINPNRAVLATYSIAKDRIDTIYLKNDYSIGIATGTNSTTPTIYNLQPSDYLYVLGYVRVDHDTYDEAVGHVKAKCIIINEYSNRRTVYTDAENNLYLCGNPFYGFSVIYYKEPKNPKEGTMWYDSTVNKFKVWRRTDDFVFNDTYTFTSIDPNDPQKFKTSTGYFKNQLRVYKSTSTDSWVKLNDYELEYYTDLLESEKDKIESCEFRVIPKVERYTKIRYSIDKYDGSLYWIPVNDTSFIQVDEVKMWAPNLENNNLVEYKQGLSLGEMRLDRPKHDFKTFLFRNTENHLKFTPHKNELSIMIDQIPLHRDQFSEITVDDIINTPELLTMSYAYGYDAEILKNIQINDKEVGLGFKLQSALDRPAFVEVNVTHRVNDTPLKNKFQRAATFNKSETIVYDGAVNQAVNNQVTINTAIPYQYGEGQLEVFLNGKLVNKKYIEEVTSTTPALIGAFCKSFKIKVQELGITTGSEITYKITTNIYNYNHVESYFEDYLLKNPPIIPGGGTGGGTSDVTRQDLTTVLNESKAYTDTSVSGFDAKYATRQFVNDLVDNKKIRVITKVQYDALVTKDPATIYIISESNTIFVNAGDNITALNAEVVKLKELVTQLQNRVLALETNGITPQTYTTDSQGAILTDINGNVLITQEPTGGI